jgi:uncharacterized protein (TIGR03086 family)
MTTTSPTQTSADIRIVFARAMATATDVIANVRPDQLDNPTPCSDYDVRGVIGHLVGVLNRVTLMGRGENPFLAADRVTGLADDAWLVAWSDAAQRVTEAWADDASLVRIVHLPWADESGALTLASYCNEIVVHTWDLATATGQHPTWDDEAVATAWESFRGMPGAGRSQMFAEVKAAMDEPYRSAGDPWADAVPVADDAPLIDRLVAWNGRRP